MSINIAINGFGRVGRAAFKNAIGRQNVSVVAINDLTDNETLAHLLKYDTVYGIYDKKLKADKKGIYLDGKFFPVYAEKDPAKLPWKEKKVDIVLECTGIFTDSKSAQAHLEAGARRVIISAPAKDKGAKTFVMGVNEEKYDPQNDIIISNASCTTNCIAPVMKIMSEEFGVVKAALTTIHSYTADQNLVDSPHKDLRRARAAAQNMVPTTTGAAIATTETIPKLVGLFDGLAIRVPTPVVSLSDIVVVTRKKVTIQQVNSAFKKASQQEKYKGIIGVTSEPVVSSDLIGSTYSGVVDLSLTCVIDKDLVKLVVWYDNEWAYSLRLVDLAEYIGKLISASEE